MSGVIENKLLAYSGSDHLGFHMPGHKRNTNLIESEIPYDNYALGTGNYGYHELIWTGDSPLDNDQGSIAFWYKSSGTPCNIISLLDGTTEKLVIEEITDNNKQYIKVRDGSEPDKHYIRYEIKPGEWNHVAYTYFISNSN